MNTTDTGGPAFPLYIPPQHAEDNSEVIEGMTLRDYFAAQAMQTVCMQYANDKSECQRIACHAYLMADVMLKARKA